MSGSDAALAFAGCSVALGTLVVVALYQTGVSRQLPDPPGRIFASEAIVSSRMAHPAGVPDSLLGLASYGVTFALLWRSRKSPCAERLLGLKLSADLGMAAFNAVRQVVRFGRLCSWCTGTALATFVMGYGGRNAIRSVTTLIAGQGSGLARSPGRANG